jgi:phosphotriesterase-related protein
VNGLVPVEKLGITLTHEHLLVDATTWFTDVKDEERKKLGHAHVAMNMLGDLRRDPFICRDNLLRRNVKLAIEEATYFKRAGGKTIVDCTTIGIGRNVIALKAISDSFQLNIVAGTGYYVDASHPKYVREETAEELSSRMISEIRIGVGKTGIRCGIIGEIGTGWPITRNEKKVISAAVFTHQKTGAPVSIHPDPFPKKLHSILDILSDLGMDMNRVVMDHVDSCGYDPEFASSLASRGCYLSFDSFGTELYYDSWSKREPSDAERVAELTELVKRGFISQILVSHDITTKLTLLYCNIHVP